MGVSRFSLDSLMWKGHSFPVGGGQGLLLLLHTCSPFPEFVWCRLLPLLLLQTWEGHLHKIASCLSCLVSPAFVREDIEETSWKMPNSDG